MITFGMDVNDEDFENLPMSFALGTLVGFRVYSEV